MGTWLTEVSEVLRDQGALLLGVVNVTPDSFSDGGRFLDVGDARAHVDRLLTEGADLVDIGGESTRPGAKPVPWQEQVERIEPVVRHAVSRGALVSVDTSSPDVAERMLKLGARVINDVSCLADPDLARVTAQHRGTLILMHSRGPMSEMLGFSEYPDEAYDDVVEDVAREWSRARDRAVHEGIAHSDCWLDPGLGFAKNARHSLELLRRLQDFRHLGTTLVVGPSRKSFIASVGKAAPSERLGGTVAACLTAVALGATVLRVHDVFAVRQALRLSRALGQSTPLGAAHA